MTKQRNERGQRMFERDEISKLLKAATDPRPARRYVKGFAAKPMIFVRKWLGDGAFEWMIRRAFG